MANQAIALQARAPQTDILGGAIRNNAQMINMMSQQRAAERQNAVAQQQMEIDRAKEARAAANEGRAIEMAELDRNSKMASLLKSDLGMIASGDVNAVRAWSETAKRLLPAWANYIPPAEQIAADRNLQLQIAATVEQIFNKEVATPTASVQYDKQGNAFSGTAGGTNPRIDRLIVGGARGTANAANAAPTAAAPAVAASPEQLGAAAQFMLNNSNASISDPALRGLSPEDMTRAQGLADQMRSGGTMQPISMNTGGQMAGGQGQPNMGAIVQDMFATGVISQSNMNTLKQFAGPEKAAQMAQIMQAKNIQIMPDEQAAPAGMRNAVFRPERDAAQMQLASTNEVGTQFQGVDPTMGRYPGSALVDPNILGAQERAKAQASKDVDVQAAPKIAAAGERAKRIEKLRGEMPMAKNNTEAIVADIDDRIRTIDKFLRNPARNQIIGPIEGNLPRFAQFGPRADAQADFDKIKNMATLSSLVDLRKSTETGASPVGANPTDRDAKIVETAASALIQTGELPKVDSEMQALRNKLYRMRENALNTYRDTYREVAAEAPELRLRVPSISPTYKRSSSQRPAAASTRTKSGASVSNW